MRPRTLARTERPATRGSPVAAALLALALGLLAACGNPVSPNDVGYLEGKASIGPLRPVERAGEPPATPSPEVCAARGLVIYRADGRTEVTRLDLGPDCSYRVGLRAGTYVVQLKPGGGFSRDLPKSVRIERAEAVRLDIDIDTGIR